MADHDDPSDTPVTHDTPVSNETPLDHDPPSPRDSAPSSDEGRRGLSEEPSSLHDEFGWDHPVSQLVSEFVELLDDVDLGDDPELDEVLDLLEETYDLESLTRESLREVIERLRNQQ